MTNQELLKDIMDFAAHQRELAQEDVEYSDDDMKDFYRGKREAFRMVMGYVRFLESREGGKDD